MAHPAVDTLRQIVDAPEYQRGPAEPGQLPYGQATQANDAAATIPAQESAPPPASGEVPPPVAMAPGAGGPTSGVPAPPMANDLPDHTPATDAEKLLLQPSANPMPAQTMPTIPLSEFATYAPLVTQAAQAPDAGPTLRALANAIAISQTD